MPIFVHTREIEDHGDTVFGKVVVVASVVVSIGIIQCIIAVIKRQIIQKQSRRFVHIVQFPADHIGADYVNAVRCISADHVNVQVCDGLLNWNQRMVSVVA